MIPVLSCEELAKAEQVTFAKLSLPSRVVMEAAGRACAELIARKYSENIKSSVIVLAGGGNNGGDGYVVARVLKQRGVETIVVSTSSIEKTTPDTAENIKAYLAIGGEVRFVEQANWQQTFAECELESAGLIVDAIFGTGFRGELRDFFQPFCVAFNELSAKKKTPIFSIDIPSGVNGDTAEVSPGAIVAHTTLTFQALKPGVVNFPGTVNCGELYIAEIGIELGSAASTINLIERSDISGSFSQNGVSGSDSHKGRKGHVAVIGGSRGHYGAPKMSGKAALRSGAGLVTICLPRSVEEELSPQLFELMSSSFGDDGAGNFAALNEAEVEKFLEGKDACVIGPGMGVAGEAKPLLEKLIDCCKEKKLPLVIDADGLNILSQERQLLKKLSELNVITPHPGEMSRLTGKTVAEIQLDRIASARGFSKEYCCWLVLKGARTVVASPDGRVWINPAATAALATAGSGDVLAGIIASLFAQKFTVEEAILSGVFLHGLSGENLEQRFGSGVGVIAGDIIEELPQAISDLAKSQSEVDRRTVRKVFEGERE